MNIDKIVNNVINSFPESEIENLYKLLRIEVLTEEIKEDIYNRFINDSYRLIDDYLLTCHDTNKDKGMSKCCFETWQSCITDIGRNYYKKYKLLEDYKHNRESGGIKYKDELLCIGLEVYEQLCYEFKKQFFIYDCTRYLGIKKDVLYGLNTIHSDLLKKAHTTQESSMRSALVSGRSNVTAMAILLNHDYDYTRTTQIIHTSDRIPSAQDLPKLEDSGNIIDIPTRNPEKTSENI